MIMNNFQEELRKLPERPGVYLMHGSDGDVLYVGKAINLKKRVKQYFVKTVNRGPQILKMIREIAWFETITVDNETEALILECNLIKEYKPRYNTLLMDDKAYPYLCLTNEAFPRLRYAHQMKRDGNEYFGPFADAGAAKETSRLLQSLFSLRTCSRKLPETIGKERPCLNYDMHRCPAPCMGYITEEAYRENVEKARRFLKGDHSQVIRELERKMKAAAEIMDFEEAARLRDQIENIRALSERQKVTDTGGEDMDILALALSGGEGMAEIYFVRGGRMIGRDHVRLEAGAEEDPAEILSQVLRQFYSGTPFLPKIILTGQEPADKAALEAMLSARSGRKTEIRVPQKGDKKGLLMLAEENAARALKQDIDRVAQEEARTVGAQKEITDLLGLEDIHRLEAYDISHISGFATVGSMVVYEDGRPRKNEYRKFRIKFVEGVNDFASLAEVLYRRFTHGLKEKEILRERGLYAQEDGGFVQFPDLILMDGGAGQVSAAEELLREIKIDIPVCGMVKDDRHRTRGLIFRGEEIPIDIHSEAFRLLTRIQDETHRFAIEYHRSLRSKAQVHSILDDIPGIGPRRRRSLMEHFGSIEEIRTADVEALLAAPGMNRPSAETVYAFFHDGEIG